MIAANLTSLILQGNELSAKGARALLAAASESLTMIDISFNNLKSETLTQLTSSGLSRLSTLDVSGNRLGDSGSSALLGCCSFFAHLADVNLSGNYISQSPKSFTLPCLYQLNLSSNTIVGIYHDIEKLKERGCFVNLVL